MGQYNDFTASQVAASFVKIFGIERFDADNRVNFAIEELEIDPSRITTKQAAEIERCVAADLKAGK